MCNGCSRAVRNNDDRVPQERTCLKPLRDTGRTASGRHRGPLRQSHFACLPSIRVLHQSCNMTSLSPLVFSAALPPQRPYGLLQPRTATSTFSQLLRSDILLWPCRELLNEVGDLICCSQQSSQCKSMVVVASPRRLTMAEGGPCDAVTWGGGGGGGGRRGRGGFKMHSGQCAADLHSARCASWVHSEKQIELKWPP